MVSGRYCSLKKKKALCAVHHHKVWQKCASHLIILLHYCSCSVSLTRLLTGDTSNRGLNLTNSLYSPADFHSFGHHGTLKLPTEWQANEIHWLQLLMAEWGRFHYRLYGLTPQTLLSQILILYWSKPGQYSFHIVGLTSYFSHSYVLDTYHQSY